MNICNAGCNAENLKISEDKIVHYEKDGDHFNVYDSDGKIIGQYASTADFGTNNIWKRDHYTIPEALEQIKKKPAGQKLNTISFTFK